MSPSFVVTLALIVLGLVALRLIGLFPVLAAARDLRRVDALVVLIGSLALLFHCLAMFFPSLAAAVPGGPALVPVIDALGVPSAVLYVVAALVTLAGIRRLHPLAVAVDAVALIAVGITMFDGGPLAAHLSAIGVAVIALAVTLVAFTGRITPRRLADPVPGV